MVPMSAPQEGVEIRPDGPIGLLSGTLNLEAGSPLTPACPHRAYPPCQRSLGIEGERVGETSFRVRR